MSITLSGLTLGQLPGNPTSFSLNDLSDVSILSPQSGQTLIYNSGTNLWQNGNLNNQTYQYLSTSMTGYSGVLVSYNSGLETIQIGLGDISVSSVVSSGTITGSNLSGTNTGDQTIILSGDATGTGTGAIPVVLSTVNPDVGTFGSSSTIPVVTVNEKGLITGVSSVTFSGTSPTATNLAGGLAGNIPFQTAPSTTSFISTGTSSQVLVGGTTPAWSSAPSITGTNFTAIPNDALTNSSVTIGSTTIALGATTATLAGLTSVTATTFNATSTNRVKKKIRPLGKIYRSRFDLLAPREYDRTDYSAHEFGFIAEEMDLIYPEIVGKDDTGKPSGIDYGKLSAILTAKIQDQDKEIKELKQTISEILSILKSKE